MLDEPVGSGSVSGEWTQSDKFKALFYLERVLEVLGSRTFEQGFIKERVVENSEG